MQKTLPDGWKVIWDKNNRAYLSAPIITSGSNRARTSSRTGRVRKKAVRSKERRRCERKRKGRFSMQSKDKFNRIVKAMEKICSKENVILDAVALTMGDEEILQVGFNPVINSCRCPGCLFRVAAIKEAISSADEYGNIPKQQPSKLN